jgi:hypothetical protein
MNICIWYVVAPNQREKANEVEKALVPLPGIIIGLKMGENNVAIDGIPRAAWRWYESSFPPCYCCVVSGVC